MSQYDEVMVIPGSTPGAALGVIIQAAVGHLMSGGLGVDTPANASKGFIGALDVGGDAEPYVERTAGRSMIFHLANVLGAVSADGFGNNTGAIMETGLTDGTYWVKFAGGLVLFMRGFNETALAVVTWTLPFPVTDTARMFPVAMPEEYGTPLFASAKPWTLNQIKVSIRSSNGAFAAGIFNGLCLGFWTEEFL